VTELAAHGLSIAPPEGWEGRIFRRAEAGQMVAASEVAGPAAPMGEETYPVVQVATVVVPVDSADYGSDVVEALGPDDALIVLKEFSPADAGQPLFERAGMPRALGVGDFSPSTLQRSLDGQGGHQTFFNENGRAFCLYVVLGRFDNRHTVVPQVNEVLGTVTVGPTP
jgi:hypothetical protein